MAPQGLSQGLHISVYGFRVKPKPELAAKLEQLLMEDWFGSLPRGHRLGLVSGLVQKYEAGLTESGGKEADLGKLPVPAHILEFCYEIGPCRPFEDPEMNVIVLLAEKAKAGTRPFMLQELKYHLELATQLVDHEDVADAGAEPVPAQAVEASPEKLTPTPVQKPPVDVDRVRQEVEARHGNGGIPVPATASQPLVDLKPQVVKPAAGGEEVLDLTERAEESKTGMAAKFGDINIPVHTAPPGASSARERRRDGSNGSVG